MEVAADAEAAERKSHYMKCPKCGRNLSTEEFHHVQIDRCPGCHGIWLDAGEIDAVVAHDDPGLMKRALGDLMAAVRGGKKS